MIFMLVNAIFMLVNCQLGHWHGCTRAASIFLSVAWASFTGGMHQGFSTWVWDAATLSWMGQREGFWLHVTDQAVQVFLWSGKRSLASFNY